MEKWLQFSEIKFHLRYLLHTSKYISSPSSTEPLRHRDGEGGGAVNGEDLSLRSLLSLPYRVLIDLLRARRPRSIYFYAFFGEMNGGWTGQLEKEKYARQRSERMLFCDGFFENKNV